MILRVLLFVIFCVPAQASVDIEVCVDYHCDEVKNARLNDAFWQSLEGFFTGVQGAHDERVRVAEAIAFFEQVVGTQTGTSADLAYNKRGAGMDGQLDCIAESKNTTRYLHLMAQRGLLQWHEVAEREVRRPLLGLLTHWTAVVRERGTGNLYAIDSWPTDNGEPPLVQNLEVWRAEIGSFW